MDTSILDKAIIFATHAHSGMNRKGKTLPYIVHPLEAAAIVATITSDQELLAAAVLHDVVEDTDTTIDQLKEEFGERVAMLVAADTNPPRKEGDTWRSRKEAAANRLLSVSTEAKMVAIGDKLSNLRAICFDYQAIGDELWRRFKAPDGRSDIAWYYRRLADALSELAGTPPYEEFRQLLTKVFGD